MTKSQADCSCGRARFQHDQLTTCDERELMNLDSESREQFDEMVQEAAQEALGG